MVAAAYGEAAQRKAWKMCGLSLSGDWNVPIKAAFCPNRRTLFPNSRIWVQSVDEDSFPAYDEDAPLDVLGIVDIGWSQFYQVPHAPA